VSRAGRAIAIGCSLLLGCATKSKSDAVSPAAAKESMGEAPLAGAGASAPMADEEDGASPALKAEERSLDELRAELEGYESRLREHGVRLRGYPEGPGRDKLKKRTPPGKVAPATNTPIARDTCAEVCEIAAAVCGLKDRICGLASVHESETEYAEACTRAERDCERASEACDDCS